MKRMLKVVETEREGRLRKPVAIHEHQFAFILRESTADAIFILYDQLLEATGNGYSFFVDLMKVQRGGNQRHYALVP